MFETICTPYGKAAFPTVVKCDGCGEVIDSGWMPTEEGRNEGGPWFHVCEEEHYCEACSERKRLDGDTMCEFRICTGCGKPMVDGMTDLDGFYTHEECFDGEMDELFPAGWRQVEDDGCDGYYEWYDPREQTWQGTGIFYTTWY